MTANDSHLGGGTRQTVQILRTIGRNPHDAIELQFITGFFEAEIACDAIFSFRWLSEFNLDVLCKRHGLQMNAIEPYFIPGLDETQVPESSGQLKIHVVSPVGGGEGSQSSTPVLDQPMLAPISRTISFSPPLRNATSHEEVEELINLEKAFFFEMLEAEGFPRVGQESGNGI